LIVLFKKKLIEVMTRKIILFTRLTILGLLIFTISGVSARCQNSKKLKRTEVNSTLDTAQILTTIGKFNIDPRGTAGGSDGVNFNRSGSMAAVANDKGECILYDVSTWSQLLKISHYKGKIKEYDDKQINNISFSANDSLFATGMNNTGVKIWEAKTGKLIKRLADGTNSDGLAFSPNGKWIAVASDNKAVVYALPDYQEIFSTEFAPKKECNSIDWSPDSKYLLAAGDSRIKIIASAGWSLINTIEVGTGSVKSIRVNPSGTMVIGTGNIGFYRGTTRVYTLPEGKTVADLPAYSPAMVITGDDDDGDTPNVEDACWSMDGAFVFAGGPYDGVIRVYRVSDWSLIGWKQGQEYNRQIEAIDCNKDGLVLTTGDDGNLFVHRFNVPELPKIFYQSATCENFINLETEDYSSKTNMGGFSWEKTVDKHASNNFSVKALPQINHDTTKDYLNYDPMTDAPKMDYVVDFEHKGKYYLWIRLKGELQGSAVHISLDDKVVKTAENILLKNSAGWNWTNVNSSNSAIFIDIPAKGRHTLNLRMAKPGIEADKIILTTDSGYVIENQ
jgi:WD40 repeat protein